ncbi:MAG TPA: DUF4157 domain-containing protein, partial [Thermoanaerobaculia bacterium]
MRIHTAASANNRAGSIPAPRFAIAQPDALKDPVQTPSPPVSFNLLRVPAFLPSVPPSSAVGIRETARAGLRTPGSGLPFMDTIQRAFGPHDLHRVQAHLGPGASASASAIQASAFTMGEHVAFAGRPSLHTAAHEAAHVVQQRGGARPAGGIGRENDVYERQADAVADRVMAGRSAGDLLDRYAGGGSGRPTAPPGLPAVQMKRDWETYQGQAKSKWTDWAGIYKQGKEIFAGIYNDIEEEGKDANKANKEPKPENATQGRLAKQAAGLYDWIKGLNSTAGGKIYELIVSQYHREQFGKDTLFLGADDRTEPDITVEFLGRRRAEEVKMVSVEDPARIDEMVSKAREQLDKPRASTTAGYTDWKIRTHINDATNPWPGTANSPASSEDFLELVSKKLINMDWRKKESGKTSNSLQISGINPPNDSGIDGKLILEAHQFNFSIGFSRSKVWHYRIDFKIVDEDTGKETTRYKLNWDSKHKILETEPKLEELSKALGISSKSSRLSLSPMKAS